ncbi:hypothetical protein BC830DRAFT_954220 [Chytriomyces sp. MP71]|nr:hypothetical protein BC830DRAFT_954220 [Chytriomyces sp. MP71]
MTTCQIASTSFSTVSYQTFSACVKNRPLLDFDLTVCYCTPDVLNAMIAFQSACPDSFFVNEAPQAFTDPLSLIQYCQRSNITLSSASLPANASASGTALISPSANGTGSVTIGKDDNGARSGPSPGVIAAIVVSVILGIILLALCLAWIWRKKMRDEAGLAAARIPPRRQSSRKGRFNAANVDGRSDATFISYVPNAVQKEETAHSGIARWRSTITHPNVVHHVNSAREGDALLVHPPVHQNSMQGSVEIV